MKKHVITLLALMSMVFLSACSDEILEESLEVDNGPEVIKIGTMGPLTGDVSWIGNMVSESANLAATKESNDAYTFEIITEDDNCEAKQAINAYNKLKSAGVKAIIGPACSSAMLATAPLAETDQIILITPSATSNEVTNAGDFVFRTAPSDALAGKIAAEFMFNELGLTKVGVNGKNDAWGQGLSTVFIETFEGLGGEITTVEKHETNATDFKTQLSKIKNSGAEAMYAPTFQTELIVMGKQMQELDMTSLTVVGGDAANHISVAEAVNGTDMNIIFTSALPNEDSFAKQFKADYETAYAKEQPVYAPEGYDGARLYMQAVKAVGSDATAVRDYLYAVEGYAGASGTITFDKNGDSVAKEIGLFTYSEGQIVEYVK